MLITVLGLAMVLPIGCGVSKPAADAGGSGGTSGSGGNGSGTGGHTGSGGFSFDASGFDLNLDGINLTDLNLDGIKVTMCPDGVKTGDACTAADKACLSGAKGCVCSQYKWTCFGG